MYYGIGKCNLKYTCTRHLASVSVKFFIEDRYDFDHIRTISGDVEQFIVIDRDIGPLANDAGLISQADGVISNYHIFITFEKIIELN